MKSTEQIINEIKHNDFLKNEVIDENSLHVKNAINFYEKYPQYEELGANAIFFIIAASKKKPVKVHKFDNGSIWFVGDIITSVNAPIASIGEGWHVKKSWNEDLKNNSVLIEEITHASLTK